MTKQFVLARQAREQKAFIEGFNKLKKQEPVFLRTLSSNKFIIDNEEKIGNFDLWENGVKTGIKKKVFLR